MQINFLHKIRLVAMCAAVSVAGACDEPTNATVAASELTEIDADNVIFGMKSFLTASGVREARVEADTAYVFADSAKLYLRQMELILYHEDGRQRATVTALRGEMNTNTDAMLAQGDVVLVVHADGRKIETSELHYDPQIDRIWSDSATVQTLAGGRVSRGTAFESDIEFLEVRILNPRGDIGEVIF
jgi:LPS export ABC transporter protein LptC